MTTIEATGTGWFRTFGPLFIGGDTNWDDGGTVRTEWRIGVNVGSRSFSWTWSVTRYDE